MKPEAKIEPSIADSPLEQIIETMELIRDAYRNKNVAELVETLSAAFDNSPHDEVVAAARREAPNPVPRKGKGTKYKRYKLLIEGTRVYEGPSLKSLRDILQTFPSKAQTQIFVGSPVPGMEGNAKWTEATINVLKEISERKY